MFVARVLSRFLALLVVVASCLFALAQWQVFPPSSWFAGASYLPPGWLFALVVPAVACCLAVRSRRFALAATGAFLLLVLPFADFRLRGTGAGWATSAQHLTVVALNVQYYARGLENVVSALNRLDADVSLLSENVLDPAGAARAHELFAPRFFRMGRSGETAIVSRYPIVAFHEIDLPTMQASLSGPNDLVQGTAQRRSFTHAVVDVNGTPVNVLSVRLIAGRAPEGSLLAQIAWGLYLMRSQSAEVDAFCRYAATLKGPVIFGGDMNAPPSASAIARLEQQYGDAYLARHFLGKATFRVRPTPFLRLDYLFSGRDVPVVASRRVDVEVSDHFPVWAEFALPGRP
jgi:endonuclease/exonuclease/phosphatase (EEP) superfamily protein YafD